MKILVFSDSHGRYANMQKAVCMHPDASVLLHLGDGIADVCKLSRVPDRIHLVKGNLEEYTFNSQKSPLQDLIDIEGKKIYMCHGHRAGVNFSMQNLLYKAMENNADIALFGHTHQKYENYIPSSDTDAKSKGIYLFNPGSISRPRDSIFSSFGIIEIKNNCILMSHGIVK